MNPIAWLKNKQNAYLFKAKMANANKKEDIEFFLHIIQYENRVYNNFIFMPNNEEYMGKLKSIGFQQVDAKETYAHNSTEFVYYYNNALNLSVYIVAESHWKALITTIDVVKQIYAPVDSEFDAISKIFKAIRTYQPSKG